MRPLASCTRVSDSPFPCVPFTLPRQRVTAQAPVLPVYTCLPPGPACLPGLPLCRLPLAWLLARHAMVSPRADDGALPGVDLALADLIESEHFNLNCVVSCARSKDCPIVYASDGFYELTGCAGQAATGITHSATMMPPKKPLSRSPSTLSAVCTHALPGGHAHPQSMWRSRARRRRRYTPEETIGRNCRFLQGRDTERNKARRPARKSSGARR
jgi:hypothetical protein